MFGGSSLSAFVLVAAASAMVGCENGGNGLASTGDASTSLDATAVALACGTVLPCEKPASIAVMPGTATTKVGAEVEYKAIARCPSGATVNITRDVEWETASATIADLSVIPQCR